MRNFSLWFNRPRRNIEYRALILNSSSSQYATASAINSTQPVLFVAWIKPTGSPVSVSFLGTGTSGSANHRRTLAANASSQVVAVVQTTAASSANAGTISDGSWQHVAGYFGTDTSRYAALNGTWGSEQTTSRAPNAPNITMVGTRGDLNAYFNGKIAFFAIYAPTDFTDAQSIVNDLQTQAPHLVQSGKLRAYWENAKDDSIGAANLTLINGATTAADDLPGISV